MGNLSNSATGLFRVGDVVRLRSGSQPMTVVQSREGFAATLWMANDRRDVAQQLHDIPESALRLVKRMPMR